MTEQKEKKVKYFQTSVPKKQTFSPTKHMTANLNKEVTFTTEKLYENFIFKEVMACKKIEEEKKKTRQYQAENQMHIQKISQLETEIKTVRVTLNEQIEMYQRMIKDLENQKRNHVLRIQEDFRIEIQTILESHEEVSKVEQARQEELEARIQELLAQNDALRSQVRGNQNNISGLKNKVEGLEGELRHNKDLLNKSENAHNKSIENYKSQIENLNKNFNEEKMNQKTFYENALIQKHKEIQNIIRVNKLESDKQENRRNSEITNKNAEIRELKSQFEAEKSGLQQLVDTKDLANNRLSQELTKQKDHNIRLTDHYQRQIQQLVTQQDALKQDLRKLNDLNTAVKISNSQLDNDNMALADEIRKLRQVLMESSMEMDKCREEFIRLDSDKQRLRRQLIECEKQLQRAKDVLIQKQQQSRNWMENYFTLKSRF